MTAQSAPNDGTQLLLDLGSMPMLPDLVCSKIVVHLGEQILGRDGPASARHTGFGVDHDSIGLDEPSLHERQQAEQRGRRIAARVRDEPGGRQRRPAKLREPVHRLLKKMRCSMLAVHAGVLGRVAQSELGSDVDDAAATLDQARPRPWWMRRVAAR